ncbi:MAG: prepilin-type N-terminal cleavage/methylation domain-containing protein [Parcubacteria group bacterium]|jgi:prepilin-type N-terminal cleavage/methylation domain-containing protein
MVSLRDNFLRINKQKGFSLLEVVSAVFIFSIVFLSVYGAFNAGLKSLVQSKRRTEAAALANEKMEIIRNLAYAEIGMVNGFPSGAIAQDEDVVRSSNAFHVHTNIRYIDDSFDGLDAEDENHIITDYKLAKVEVTWAGASTGKGVIVVSKFVPDGVESDVGGGSFRINILDGTGSGISGVDTRIINSSIPDPVDIHTTTDSSGTILLVLPEGDRSYEISVLKDGYENVTTMPPYPTTAYDPTDEHASVIAGYLNTKGIIIDKLSTLNISTRSLLDAALPSIGLHIDGGRIIGTDHVDPLVKIKNVIEDVVTDENGTKNLTDTPPGVYNVALTEPNYTLVETSINNPVPLSPAQTADLVMYIAPSNVNSLVVKLSNAVTGDPVERANVRVFNGTDFDQTQITAQKNYIYFPPFTDPPTTMSAGSYTVEVSVDGYESYTGSVDVNLLTQMDIQLNPITP